MHQSESARHLAKAVGFSPDAVCDGVAPHWVVARSLEFNPQALDACQTMAVLHASSGTADLYMLERHQIENQTAETIAQVLTESFDRFCVAGVLPAQA